MKKLLSILMLLVAIVTGASGATEIFKMTGANGVTSGTEGTDYTATETEIIVKSGKTVGISATCTNGTVEVYNGHSKNDNLTITKSTGLININNSGNSYVCITLTSGTIQEGDVIAIDSYSEKIVKLGKVSETVSELSIPYTVASGSALIGSNKLYIKRGADIGTFSTVTITRPDPTDVATPSITFSANKATITCATPSANIYYTLDGTEPTKSSTAYSAAVTLPNSCTVRAKAFNTVEEVEYSSEEATKDCYVDHSAAEGFLTILKFNGGSVGTGDAAKVWTSTDGKYILTDKNNDQTYKYTSLEAANDAFKLSHVDGYTLSVPSNVKITKVAFIGKSLYRNYAGSVTMNTAGFTPTNASFIQNENIDNFPMYLSTIEFTNSSLGYGDAIDFNPGGCESAAYIELYGEIKQNAIAYDDAVENGTISGAASAAEGVTVTVTATPADGYEFGALVIMNGETDVTSECSVEGTTFVMPAYDVTVSATFNVETPKYTYESNFKNQEGADFYFNITNTGSVTNGIKSIASGYSNVPEGYSNAVYATSPSSSGSSAESKFVTKASYTKINAIEISAARGGSNDAVKIEVSPNADFSDAVTTVYTKTAIGDSNNKFATITVNNLNASGYIRLTFTYGGNNRTTVMAYLKVTAEGASESVTTNAAGWTSFTPMQNETITGAKAYIVTAVDNANKKVTVREVTTMKGGEGYFIKGSASSAYETTATTAAADDVTDNMLVGCTSEQTLSAGATPYKYFLGTKAGTAGLYYVGSTAVKIPAGKCYLQTAITSDPMALSISFEDDATAITNVNANENANAEAPVKVIKNGKLYIGNYNVAGQQVK